MSNQDGQRGVDFWHAGPGEYGNPIRGLVFAAVPTAVMWAVLVAVVWLAVS